MHTVFVCLHESEDAESEVYRDGDDLVVGGEAGAVVDVSAAPLEGLAVQEDDNRKRVLLPGVRRGWKRGETQRFSRWFDVLFEILRALF